MEKLVQWVKMQDGKILLGPSTYKHDDTFVEYEEIINITRPFSRLIESVEMVDGKCVKTVTSITDYKVQREAEYPPITDYIDGIVKGDQTQIDAYIAACQTVKAKYPKPTE